MLETPEFLRKSAEKCGFVREAYNEGRIPTSVHNLVVLPFFGDIRASFVMSTLLLKRLREELKGSKYFIFCSWPGHRILYPFVDEYWSIKDASIISGLMAESRRFKNGSNIMLNFYKELNQCFYEILDSDLLEEFYHNGLTDTFMTKFRNIKRHFPMIPSKGILSTEFNRVLANRNGYKIMVYPSMHIKNWRQKVENMKCPKEFWVSLVERLNKEGYVPVVLQGYGMHDLTRELSDKCILFPETDLAKVMSGMRAVDCVLDVFNDISRFAGIARTPYVACVDRARYIQEKDYELDDLCLDALPKQYIFSFTTIIERGDETVWNLNIFDNIIARLGAFLPDIEADKIPTASELNEEVSYKNVRVRKLRRLGSQFLKVPRD